MAEETYLIYGTEEDDTLESSIGNDIIYGGAGNDTYIFNTIGGMDTIVDSDGLGKIIYDETLLAGGNFFANDEYVDEFNNLYKWDGVDGSELIINDQLTVENFKNGDLGINLDVFTYDGGGEIEETATLDSYISLSNTTAPGDLFFSPDGTKLYITDTATNYAYQYELSTPWNTSTAVYSGNSVNLSSLNSKEVKPSGLYFSSDGTKMYSLSDWGTDVYQYDLATPWNISTASYSGNSANVCPSAPYFTLCYEALSFSPDGENMFVTGYDGTVKQYSLSTGWDVSTAIYSGNFDVSAQVNSTDPLQQPSGIFFSSTGDEMYIVTGKGSNEVFKYSLANAWDVSTASYTNISFELYDDAYNSYFDSSGVFFDAAGSKMYVTDATFKSLYQYTITGSSGGTGGSEGAEFIGDQGDNVIVGGLGADTMSGLEGNDIYYVNNPDDIVIENAGEGIDTVNSSIDYVLPTNVENLILRGPDDINGTGNELDNELTGNAGNNVLDGQDGNDILRCNEGSDTLIGGAGNDHLHNNVVDVNYLIGGTGDDTYYLDSENNVLIENANEGIDKVYSSVDHTLAVNFENLELTGSAIYATGNELDNEVVGNALDNVINAAAGNDTINAGQGNDIISDVQGNDTYIYQIGDGQDAILDQSGTDAIMFNGISSDNILIFKNENDLIVALDNGSGDILNAPDKITIKDWYLGNKIESLVFDDGVLSITDAEDKVLEILNIEGDGTVLKDKEGDSIIQSIEGDNQIKDFSGDDIVYGGAGNDTFHDFDGSDRYIFNTGDGQDALHDLSQNTDDKILFGSDVSKDDIAFYMKGSNLTIAYSENDEVVIKSQGSANHGIETFELSDGSYLTDVDINQIVQDMTAYASDNGISIKSVEDVQNSTELMNIIVSSWNPA